MASTKLFARVAPDYLRLAEAAARDYAAELESCDEQRALEIEESIEIIISQVPMEISSDGLNWKSVR